jgi:hypothetical protein
VVRFLVRNFLEAVTFARRARLKKSIEDNVTVRC